MFARKIARSAEEVQRWALKRLFKFFLKKKLGQLLLGDIDHDQLDVQLSQGSVHLSDLALNVDYLNDKFGAATSLIIKEGSIGSLMLKLPWKGTGFQVEVDELEVVLGPCGKSNSPSKSETNSCSQVGDNNKRANVGNLGHDTGGNAASTSNDVHEGVKTIAKMVKWFLTSFHVKVNRLIVAFEPWLEENVKKVGSPRTLVLRVSEIECGTCVSEEVGTGLDARGENFLGISQITNFVKFKGAVLELLQLEDTGQLSASRPSSGNFLPQHSLKNATTPVLIGKEGGFSGKFKLSIPWNNGSLDLRELDYDICIDPLKLEVQPRMIKWFLLAWENFKKLDGEGRADVHCESSGSIYYNSSTHFLPASSFLTTDTGGLEVPTTRSGTSTSSSLTGKESSNEAMQTGPHLIPDWVPNYVKENEMERIHELDLAASVDQFFECFEGMRNSQSALGNSGMWNWTCSVFSALTAASNLASGSLHIPSEQQHVQTNLKATLVGITVLVSFCDEDQDHLYDPEGDMRSVCSNVHYLCVEGKDIYMNLQVCPQGIRSEVTVGHIEAADFLCNVKNVANDVTNEDCHESTSLALMVQNLQAEVEGALPPSGLYTKSTDSDELSTSIASFFPSRRLIKMQLLSTMGATQCSFNIDSSNGSSIGLKSLSLRLPQFVFWVHFRMINSLMKLMKDIRKSTEIEQGNEQFFVEEKQGSCNTEMKKGPGTAVTSTEILRGNISIPNARIIFCFPVDSGKGFGGCSHWDQFMAIDFFSPSNLEKEKFQDISPMAAASAVKRRNSNAASSVHFDFGNLGFYLINSTCKCKIAENSSDMQKQVFHGHKIFWVSNRANCCSRISMYWGDSTMTGSWMVEKARSLVTSEESRSSKNFMAKGYDFAAASSMHREDMNSQTRQQMILGCAFSLNVCLFPVTIDLDTSLYRNLHCLLDQLTNGLAGLTGDVVSAVESPSLPQTSIHVECESLEIIIRPETKEDVKSALQSELSGSWHFLKLNLRKFDMLCVSNIGGVAGANLFWLAHGEGELRGSITEVSDREFLLISCTNSSRNRGDGGGSSVLSRPAGSDIIHMWYPKTSHNYMSITVRCATVAAPGGRLDWLDSILSFFSLPPVELEKVQDKPSPKKDTNISDGTYFFLKFADVGLSYEPFLKNLVAQNLQSEAGKAYVTGLLAAASLIVSKKSIGYTAVDAYRIRLQDIGLLLCGAYENPGGSYSVDYLREMGYVKVARGALIEAILRMNSTNSSFWELESSKSNIYVDTCHDTTSGLICLATQLQKLFAPDIEDSIVHLQSRWDNVHQELVRNELNDDIQSSNDTASPSVSQMHATSYADTDELGMHGLMDEISEDVFHLDVDFSDRSDFSESEVPIPDEDNLVGDTYNKTGTADVSLDDLYFEGLVPLIGPESCQTLFLQDGSFPEIIDGYCLSELRPLSELTIGTSPDILKSRSKNFNDENHGRGNSKWYEDASLRVVENHILESSSTNQDLDDKLPTIDSANSSSRENATGRLVLKNVNLIWRMYAGCEWHKKEGKLHGDTIGRDINACLELTLSQMQFQYDFFPVRGTCASKLSLSVQELYLCDRSKSAPWKMVLGYYHSKDHPRDSSSNALRLELEAVRPDPLIPLEEYRLRVAFLPMVLHLHQTQLNFLISFFGTKGSSADESSDSQNSGVSELCRTNTTNLAGHTIADEALLPYFQKFDIWPILLRVDYRPSRVDLAALRGGKYVELVNLVPWKGVELELKHVQSVGVYGWGSVCETIIGEWLEDISQNQIHNILRGLPPIRSLVAVGSGAAKLVSSPVDSYRKDKRVLKGMQRGTIAFLRSLSLEAVGLGVHLAENAREILLQAEYIVTTVPRHISPVQGKSKQSAKSNQPKDAQQGIKQAYESLSDGLGKSASALVGSPLKKYQRGASAGSALATALRGVPAAAMSPVSACASAVHITLLGVRNSLDPEHKRESMEKYLGPNHHHEWD